MRSHVGVDRITYLRYCSLLIIQLRVLGPPPAVILKQRDDFLLGTDNEQQSNYTNRKVGLDSLTEKRFLVDGRSA